MSTPLASLPNVSEEPWVNATSTYDSLDWQRRFVRQVFNFIRQQAGWLSLTTSPGADVRVLDYACGPGVVSLSLLPYVTETLGVDINPHQVSEYNRRAALCNLPTTLCRALDGDLLTSPISPSLTAAVSTPFDYVVISAALHHVDDPADAVTKLSQHLKSGGKFVVVDFLAGEDDIAASEEDRRRMNEEYRTRSHDNTHMTSPPVPGQHGHSHTHSHGHDHSHGHGHDHSHGGHGHGHDHGEGEGEGRKRHGPHGFTLPQMESHFTAAGLVDVKSVIAPEKIVIEGFGEWDGFMMQGTKA
ncbi:hypothetical protein ABW21_db0204835 [Orbilia brochopaga]|nr:hypothetical protein ABW21_db0204835 [Drechslerella brochopaga]